ncbi:MAG: metalloregulator ArsR/SmtB family transcription factor [Saprospiraceae bacterium]
MRIRKEEMPTTNDDLFLAQIADALAHPVRMAILRYVLQNEEVSNDTCNKDLVELFDYSQATISQHVKKMIQADLFLIEKKDKFSFYAVNKEVLGRYYKLMEALLSGP